MTGLRRDRLGVSVLGAGTIGAVHAATIERLDGFHLVSIVDTDPVRAGRLANAHQGAGTHHDLESVLADPEVDAVAVCTPSGHHAEAVLAALASGRHVIVEKPLDVNPVAVAAVVKAASESDKVVTVISQHRFDAASVLVKRVAASGELGRLTSATVSMPWWRTDSYYDSAEWRGTWALDGGGALMNQAIHSIDLLLWFMGNPREVFARTATLAHSGIEVEDTAVATVVFESGALAVVHATTAAFPGSGARLQVHGDKGSAVIESDQLSVLHTSGGIEGSELAMDSPGKGAEALPSDRHRTASSDPAALSDAHAAQYKDFLAAVQTGRQPLVGVRDAARVLTLIWAMYESARTSEPVEITA